MALTVPANAFDLLGEESDVSNLVSIIHDPIAVAAHKAAESKKREEVREAERKRRKEVQEAERKLEEEARKKKEEEERASMARRLENRRKWFESQEQKRIQLEEYQRRQEEKESRKEERKKKLEEDRKLKEENPSKWEEVRKRREMQAKKEGEESIKAAFLASNRPRVSKSPVQRRGPGAYPKGQVHGGTKTQVRKTPSTISDASDISSVFSSSATRPSSLDQTQEVAKNGLVSSTSTSTVVSTSSEQETEREEAKDNGKNVDGWQQVPSRRQGSTGGDGESSNKSFDGRRRQNMNGSALRKLKKKKAATGGEKTQGEKTQEVDSSLVQNQNTLNLSYTLKEYEEMKQRKDKSLQNKDDVNNVVSQPRPKPVIFYVNKGFRTPEKDHRQRGFGNGGRRFNNEGPKGRRFNNGAPSGRRVDERDNKLQCTKENSATTSFSLKDAEFPSLLKKA